MGWDGTGINCYGMGWDRKICPMDKPGNLTYKKHIENLTQHLSEKSIGDNLSITDIVSKIEVCRFSVSPRTF